ncbi:PREDICTED: protein PRY1-like isoform X1 [Branchiostoma belcheri]|uniref:Protein PRY1-like isoform X1 n=1 Tax=Branchiostoma belcheri TaxID=7741 RepID=A0A6P5A229_BRABE|nr:PREDICTED: protein PRY1-like isoform X1 [Branchiostoma belcheri]
MRPLVPVLAFCLAFLPAAVKCAPTEDDLEDDLDTVLPDANAHSIQTPPIPEDLQEVLAHEPIPEPPDGQEIEEADEFEDHEIKKRAAGKDCSQDFFYYRCRCRIWAKQGFCTGYFQQFMTIFCPKSCAQHYDFCIKPEETCEDVWPSSDYCKDMSETVSASHPIAVECCPETFDLCPTPPPPTSQLSEFDQNCLDNHNAKRQIHNTPPMAWCEKCAEESKRVAIKLKNRFVRSGFKVHPLKHSTRRERTWVVDGKSCQHGENMYWTFSSAPSCTGETRYENCIESWYEELGIYKNKRRGGRPVKRKDISLYGHVTQMLWKASTGVGCARSGDGPNNILVCMYEASGNLLSTTQFNRNVNVDL